MDDNLHAAVLPGTVAWVAERLGMVGHDGAVSVHQLSSLTIGQMATIPFIDSSQIRDFVTDLSVVLGSNGTSMSDSRAVAATVATRNRGTARLGRTSVASQRGTNKSTKGDKAAGSTAVKGIKNSTVGRATKATKRSEMTQRIAAHLSDHPGSTLAEIADVLGATEHEVAVAARPVDWLILDPSELIEPTERVESATIKATRERARAAMQAASLITSPLSHQAYTTLVREGRVKGPSVARIVQLFGSWTAACAEVGVSSGEPLRKNYQRNWTNEDLLGYVQRFLAEPRYRGASHQYDKWRATQSKREKVPSLGTVRNLLGGTWNEIRAQALRDMRSRWATRTESRAESRVAS